MWDDHEAWWWGPSMECATKNLLLDVICMLQVEQRSQPTLIYLLVDQRRFNLVQSDSFHHKIVHFTPIPQDIRAKSTHKHAHVHLNLRSYCDSIHILF